MEDANSLRLVSAVEHVRTNAHMYFEGGDVSIGSLLEAVLGDLAHVGDVAVSFSVTGHTAQVAASADWMQTSEGTFEELWRRFVMPTPKRTNSLRSEVLLAAVCHGIRTEGRVGCVAIGADLPAPDTSMRALAGDQGRWLVFQLRP
jgi:hypothetical protein